jgi:ribosome-associated protein
VILDMRPVCIYTDFFVIVTGRNPRQTVAIWDEVREAMKRDHGVVARSVEGTREGTWIVGDFLDVVLHVFTSDAREYYALEELWGDVPALEVGAVSA